MDTAAADSDHHPPQVITAKRITASRLRKGLSQLELAQRAGVSRTTLFQLERGAISNPRPVTLNKLACALDLPVHLLSAPPLEPNPSRSEAAEFDRQTNPYVAVVSEQYPQVFAAFGRDDWDELYSSFGTGGALTEEGVLQLALKIARKRETLRRVAVLLETHLAEPTCAMVDSLFELVEVRREE